MQPQSRALEVKNKNMSATEERKNLYATTRADLLVRQLSNSENFDKAILSLSTGALGLSLTFIKFIVPLEKAISIGYLTLSWLMFGAAIIATLLSFVSSQLGINKQLVFAKEYYLNNNEEFLAKTNWFAKITNYLNYAAGLFFAIAVATTIFFVTQNLKGESKMTENKSGNTPIHEGATIPTMQKVTVPDETRGATIPDMQPVPEDQSGDNNQSD
jgi:hypothetical protein